MSTTTPIPTPSANPPTNPADLWGFGQQADPTTYQHGVTPADFVKRNDQGYRQSPVGMPQTLQQTGFMKCPTPSCDFYLSPEQQTAIEQSNGYFTCPKCHQTYNLRHDVPEPTVNMGSNYEERAPGQTGGLTKVGITPKDFGQIGENIIAQMGSIPGYGPITHMHSGGASANSTFDAYVDGWGVEIKAIDMRSLNHRWIPGGNDPGVNAMSRAEKVQKMNATAEEEGLKGCLGILVLLDFRRDKAEIFAREMPIDGTGVVNWRKHNGTRLVGEVPFTSPFKDPNSPIPDNGEYNAEDYYESPEALTPAHLQQEADEIPF
jgi:hypothetical protein